MFFDQSKIFLEIIFYSKKVAIKFLVYDWFKLCEKRDDGRGWGKVRKKLT